MNMFTIASGVSTRPKTHRTSLERAELLRRNLARRTRIENNHVTRDEEELEGRGDDAESSDDSDDEKDKAKASKASSTGGADLAVDGSSASVKTIGGKSDGDSLSGISIAAIVLGSLLAISLIGLLLRRLWRRRRLQQHQEYDLDSTGTKVLGPKSDIRIMNAAIAAAYAAGAASESGNREAPQYSASLDSRNPTNTTTGWLSRQVSKMTHPSPQDAAASPPQDPRVAKWMDHHASRMLDPMWARASIVSSTPTGLGPPPSVSPASVIVGHRESVLSEMGQIQRAAVPPPLDVAMVDRVRRMQQSEGSATTGSKESYLVPPLPTYNSGATGARHSVAGTESTWNTWGVDQHKRV